MPNLKDFYTTLGVGQKATATEIKKSYRRLARKYHPDRNPGNKDAEEQFKDIQEAYETLSDPNKRRRYDVKRRRSGRRDRYTTKTGKQYQRRKDGTYERAKQQKQKEPIDPTGAFSEGETFGGFSDIFNQFFGGKEEDGAGPSGPKEAEEGPTSAPEEEQEPQPRGYARRADVDARSTLSFAEALRGGRTEVTLPDGEKVRINIPKGMRPGFKVRLRGRGAEGLGGIRGDLYVTFNVKESPDFRREGDDLYTTIIINPIEAMIGTERNILNAYGVRIKVTIAPGTQPSETLRLRGQGVDTKNGQGDLYVEIKIRIPKDLTAEQRKALREAARKVGLI